MQRNTLLHKVLLFYRLYFSSNFKIKFNLGPKPNTSHDFWRMVLLYKTESIVMLTSLVENNKIKCHEYFPKLNGHVTFDNIKIVCTNEQNFPNYVKRILQVEKVNNVDIYV